MEMIVIHSDSNNDDNNRFNSVGVERVGCAL